MKVSVFIPTYNAMSICGDVFTANLSILQSYPFYRRLIIDSSSLDNTLEIAKQYNFENRVIKNEEFDHGATRELALEILEDADIIVYLTQDVLLANSDSIVNLINIFETNNKVSGCFGRQLPHNNADLLAKHLRLFNYSPLSYTRNYSDRYVFGIRCVFSSDSFAAYRVDILRNIGGFPDRIIFGEDSFIFAKMLEAGYEVAYVAEAICYHSHNYSIKDEFKRYFDIGVFHRSQNWIIQSFGHANKEGLKFVLSEWKFLLLRAPWLLPKSIIKTVIKYLGYKLGYNYDIIGVRLCRKFTTNKSFWW